MSEVMLFAVVMDSTGTKVLGDWEFKTAWDKQGSLHCILEAGAPRLNWFSMEKGIQMT